MDGEKKDEDLQRLYKTRDKLRKKYEKLREKMASMADRLDEPTRIGIAREAIIIGMDFDTISQVTGLSHDEIEALAKAE